MKDLHNQAGCQPPRALISPSPPEVEIASVDDRVNAFLNSDLYNQYGSNFGSDIGASLLTVYLVHLACSLHFGLDLIMELTRH
jgi:hypothetical protein